MTTLIGIVIVFLSILGGFAMHEGNLHVLFQPSEFVIIGGAGLGSLIVMVPPKLFRKIVSSLPSVFRKSGDGKEGMLDVLGLLYEIFAKIKRDGALAVEKDVEDPAQSEIFRKYPGFLANGPAVGLLCDTLRLITMGASVPPHDLDELMTVEIESHEEDGARVTGSIQALADAFPGLGIVAAVLGVIINMGKMSEPPEVIGHSIAAALVGTFLGILMCYGVVGPLAKNLENRYQSERKVLEAIKAALLAFAKDIPPRIAVEFGRRVLLADEKPGFEEVEAALKRG